MLGSRGKIRQQTRCDHVRKSVETSREGKVTILWNQQVRADRTNPNNKPDIINRDNDKKECVYCCNLWRQKCDQEKSEKILKYEDLIIEIQCKWNVKAEVTPVITGATRTISKSLKQYLSNILGEHEIKELQKTTICLLGTAHILRKFLM